MVYRITSPVRAVVQADNGSKLTELPTGSVLVLTNLEGDSNGMIEATSNDRSVLIFLNDLEDKSEPMNIKVPSATVRISPAGEVTDHNQV